MIIFVTLLHNDKLRRYFDTGCMERLYLNGRLKDLGSGQQHKVAPGCGGEERVRDQGQDGADHLLLTHPAHQPLTPATTPDDPDCHHNTSSLANEVQVSHLL